MAKRAAVQDSNRVCKKSKALPLIESSCEEVALNVDHCAADVPLLTGPKNHIFSADEILTSSPSSMPAEVLKTVELPARVDNSAVAQEHLKIFDGAQVLDGTSEVARSQAEILRRAVLDFEKSLAHNVKSLESSLSDALEQKAALDSKAVCLSDLRADAESARRKANDGVAALTAQKARVSERVSITEQRRECQAAQNLQLAIIRDGATVFVNGVFEKPTDPKHVDALVALFEKIGLTDTLVSSFPPAAARLPAERTDFMNTVISQVEQDLLAHVAVLDAKLAAGEEALGELEVAARGASQSAAAAEALLEGSLQPHAAHSAEEAQEASVAMTATIAAIRVELDAARRSAEDFGSGPASSLRDWTQHYNAALGLGLETTEDSARLGGA